MHTPSAETSAAAPSPRKFGLTIGPLLLVLAAVVAWRGHTTPAKLLEAIGGMMFLLAIVLPRMLAPVLRGWMALGHAMGRVMTPVLFTLLWLVAFVPMGVLRRTFSRSPLARDAGASSYWTARPRVSAEAARASLERQF